jgi:phage gpG-like protein
VSSFSFPPTVGLNFEWEYPEPPVIAYKLAQLEAYLENTTPLMEGAKKVLQVDMAQKFEDESDPMGVPWAELKQPAPEQVGILRLTTDMYEAAISDEAWDVTPAAVYFETGVLPGYWVYHEQPEGGGQGQRIPQREFVGPTFEAQGEIEALGIGWLEIGVARAASTGGLGGRGMSRSSLGSFTPSTPASRAYFNPKSLRFQDPQTGRFVKTSEAMQFG